MERSGGSSARFGSGDLRSVNASEPSSPVVVRRMVVGVREVVVRDLMVFWCRGVRACQVRVVEGAVSSFLIDMLLERFLLCLLRVKPWLARAAVRGQKVMWPSVLAVHSQRIGPRRMWVIFVRQVVL